MYFAHETSTTSESFWSSIGTALQRPWLAFLVVSIVCVGLMLGSLWLLKRYTSWQFAVIPEKKKRSK